MLPVRMRYKPIKCPKCKKELEKENWVYHTVDKVYKNCCEECGIIYEVKDGGESKTTDSITNINGISHP